MTDGPHRANRDLALALIAGAALGAIVIGTALAAVLVVRDATASESDGPTSVTGACSGATWQVDVSTVEGAVVAHVSILDRQRRTWTVQWPNGAGSSEVTVSGRGGSAGFTSAVLGDTDDGSERTILARPVDDGRFCRLSVAAE